MNRYLGKLQQLLPLVTSLLLVMAISIRRDAKLLGRELKPQEEDSTRVETLVILEDGSVRVNTTALGREIIGYAGPVPLEIIVADGRVRSFSALENAETPRFFRRASTLLSRWNGLTVEEAQRLSVEGVARATYTSRAIIGNVQRGLQYVAKNPVKKNIWTDFDRSAKALAGLIVVLLASILPLFVKSKGYRVCQLILNVVVLGFWCGHFLNYTSLIGYMSNGMNAIALIVPVIMLITAFVYPFFGKKSYYCTYVCPFGAIQELAGKCVGYKIKMKSTTTKSLDMLRQLLLALLMLSLWTGVWFDWIDYEPFSAFAFQSASWVVIGIAILFVALSTVIVRPYCRFVCPTGSLFKFSQLSISKNGK